MLTLDYILFLQLFDTFTQAAGPKDGVLLTADILIDSMKMHRDGLEFRQLVGSILNSLLSHMKVDQEGYLSYPEYRRFYENVGFTNVLLRKLLSPLLIQTTTIRSAWEIFLTR